MNKNSIPYCRLEGFHNLVFENNTNAFWQESIFLKHNVYATNFDTIESLKQKVKKATKIWINSYPEKEKKLTYKNWHKNQVKKIYDEKRDRYPGFLIYNRKKDWKAIGYCYEGWYTLENNFAKYLNSYIFDLYGSEKFHEYRNKLKGKNFLFLIPEVNEVHERNLLSNQLIDIELNYFLEGKEITEEIKQEVYYPEMIRRGYIDILGST